MKRTILTTIAAFLCGTGFAAAADVTTGDVKAERKGDALELSFKLDISGKAVKSDYTLTVTPVLMAGGEVVKLPAVKIQGSRARISEERRAMSGLATKPARGIINARNGETVNYSETIDYRPWMDGARLELRKEMKDCCRAAKTSITVAAASLNVGGNGEAPAVGDVKTPTQGTVTVVTPPAAKQQPAQATKPATKPAATAPAQTTPSAATPAVIPASQIVPAKTAQEGGSTADRLAAKYSFIMPLGATKKSAPRQAPDPLAFDYNMPLVVGKGETASQRYVVETVVDVDRTKALKVTFRPGSATLDRGYEINNVALVELASSVRAIAKSGDGKIERVEVVGFSSPNPTVATAERLAGDRAMAVKMFIINNTTLAGTKIVVKNGGPDWKGLRGEIASSSLHDKGAMLNIIDNTPIWDSYRKVGRMGELMRYGGGQPYHYISKYFYPELNNVYIIIYYSNL